jgi:4-diphosphocytidyl-2-C-methyl-D-erythritol kinase
LPELFKNTDNFIRVSAIIFTMLCFPNCKINIGLYVTNRRADGYHDLETVFFPLPIHDALEIIPAKGEASLTLSGKGIAGDKESNLVWKAYKLLQQLFPEKVGEFDIYLHKALPMGAGLGGGSADGAFALKLVNDYCELGLSEEQLLDYALQLGSDCPFFIKNRPQYATGRGEQMSDIALDLKGYTIELVCPGVHVSTSKAFQMMRPKPAEFDLRRLGELPIAEWKNRISNDFEGPVFEQQPELKDIKDALYAQGAIYASMSGSGSSIYGIFPQVERGRRDGLNMQGVETMRILVG